MKELEIGLKVATMPVMVLAVGLGVDYAFYIYNRLQFHLSEGLDITTAYQQTLFETGNGGDLHRRSPWRSASPPGPSPRSSSRRTWACC